MAAGGENGSSLPRRSMSDIESSRYGTKRVEGGSMELLRAVGLQATTIPSVAKRASYAPEILVYRADAASRMDSSHFQVLAEQTGRPIRSVRRISWTRRISSR